MAFAPLNPQSFFVRTVQVILLAVIVITAVAYPLCLPDYRMDPLLERFGNAGWFYHFYPFISCGFSPLVLKEAAFLVLLVAGLFVFTWMKVWSQWQGREQSALKALGSGRRLWLAPELWLVVLLGYTACSVAWSPVFEHSLYTLILLGGGVAFAFLAGAVAALHRLVPRFMITVTAVGVFLAAVALLQHLGHTPWLAKMTDPRNRMSSLIGHNTGLSAWLLFPLSFSIYFVLMNRRWWVRGLCVLVIALLCLVIVAAESRAVWVLAAVMMLVLPAKLYSIRSGKSAVRITLVVIAGLMVGFLGLILLPNSHPLGKLPASINARVTGHVLNLDQLRRETRLRILAVSMTTLVPEAPVLGSGIGSFSWVYPEAQGKYFQARPDSRLGTTIKRTDLAHNEYLQVLVELGLVGLLLLGITLVALLAGLRRTLRDLHTQWDRARWWTLTFPAFCVGVHCLVDFPMHVVPIALVTLASVQLAHRSGLDSPVIVDETAERPGGSGRGAVMVSLVITTVIFAWTPWALAALVGRPLVSDAHFNSGRQWLESYYNSDGQTFKYQVTVLERARRAFRQSVVSNVFNGEAYEGQATASVNRGALALEMRRELLASGETTRSEQLAHLVARDSASAISVLQNQLAAGGLRYHFTYYLIGRAWRLQWELEKDKIAASDSEAYLKSVKALRTALAFNPADAVAVRELADMLSQQSCTRPEAHALLSRLFELDPDPARELLVDPALDLAAAGELDTARAMLDPILASHPDVPAVHAAKVWLAYYQAVWPPAALDELSRTNDYQAWRRQHLEPVIADLESLPEHGLAPFEKERLKLLVYGAVGNMALAEKASDEILSERPDDAEARIVAHWIHKERFGGGIPAKPSVHYYRTSAILAVSFMDSLRSNSLTWTGQVYGLGGKLTVGQARRIAAFCAANGWWSVLARSLPTILKDYPGEEVLLRYKQEAEQHTSPVTASSEP